MTVEELSRLAAIGKRPEQAEPYDLLSWYELRDVYRDFKAGRISKDQGEREKVRIIFDRQKFCEQIEAVEQDVQNRAAFWIAIENAATEYNNDPSTDTADRFLKAVYGTGRIRKGRW